MTQIGTETAVVLYFRRDLARIGRAWTRSLTRPELRGDPDARMGWLVIVSTVPIGVLGFTLADTIETTFRDLRLIGGTLIVLGLVLYAADRLGAHQRTLDDLSWRDGVLLGLAQACALVPGVSRSGATISMGLALGYRREAAARYAFLLAIPAVLASGGYELLKIGEGPAPAWGPTILATVIAGGVGYTAIAWLLRYISTHSFLPFVVYRVLLGAGVLALNAAGVLAAT